jgi:hypothetical protein
MSKKNNKHPGDENIPPVTNTRDKTPASKLPDPLTNTPLPLELRTVTEPAATEQNKGRLKEIVDNHPIIQLCIAVVAGAGIAWTTCEAVRVKPEERENERLEKHVNDIKAELAVNEKQLEDLKNENHKLVEKNEGLKKHIDDEAKYCLIEPSQQALKAEIRYDPGATLKRVDGKQQIKYHLVEDPLNHLNLLGICVEFF